MTRKNGIDKSRTTKISDTTAALDERESLDGGWGWVVVAASFFCNLVVDGIVFSYGRFNRELNIAFGESKAKVALVGSLLSGTYLISGPFASALANQYGFRTIAIIGSIIASLAFVASSCATSMQFLFISYGIFGGIGFGMIFVPSVIVPGFYFEKLRALATGIAVCGSGIGAFVLAPFSAWLIETFTWRGALLAQSGLILMCAVVSLAFRPLKRNMKCVDDQSNGTSPLLSKQNLAVEKNTISNGCSAKCEKISETSSTENNHNDGSYKSNSSNDITRTNENEQLWKLEMKEPLSRQMLLSESYKSQSCVNSQSAAHAHAQLYQPRRNTTGKIDCHHQIRKIKLANKQLHYESQNSIVSLMINQLSLLDEREYETPKSTLGALCWSKMKSFNLGVPLLRSYTFNLLAFSGFLTSMGLLVPYIYIEERALQFGIESATAAWLISILGMANTIGRIAFGVLSSFPSLNTIALSNCALTVTGLCTIFSGYYASSMYQYFYVSVFGFTVACFSSLRTIIVVDLMGLENLSSAFGLLLLFQGIASIIGPPLAGYFIQYYGNNYNAAFYLSGSLILLSAICCYPMEILNKWETNRLKKLTNPA